MTWFGPIVQSSSTAVKEGSFSPRKIDAFQLQSAEVAVTLKGGWFGSKVVQTLLLQSVLVAVKRKLFDFK